MAWLAPRQRSMALPVCVATVLLFAVSPLVAAHSLDRIALLSMIPFAVILAFASLGQMLVMQQGGLDLSTPGTISLGAVIIDQFPNGDGGRIPLAVVIALLAGAVAGLLNGLVVSWLRVTPLIATLGMNALLYGVIYQYTGGNLNANVPTSFVNLVSRTTLGIPHSAIMAIVLICGITLVMRKTTVGRHFELIGASAAAARAAGLRVSRYRIWTYAVASLLYAAAGALLAGYTRTPTLTAGDPYLLPTVVAVVLGGTVLGAGRGSVLGTAVGALFFEQLDQLLVTLGAPQSVQYLVEALIVALGMGLRGVRLEQLKVWFSRPRAKPPGPADAGADSQRRGEAVLR